MEAQLKVLKEKGEVNPVCMALKTFAVKWIRCIRWWLEAALASEEGYLFLKWVIARFKPVTEENDAEERREMQEQIPQQWMRLDPKAFREKSAFNRSRDIPSRGAQ